MPEMEFGNAADMERPKLKSPYERLMERVKEEGELYTFAEVQQMIGVSQPTIRKVTNDEKFPAPSKVVTWGRRHVWLFTRDDVIQTAKALRVDVTWPLKSKSSPRKNTKKR